MAPSLPRGVFVSGLFGALLVGNACTRPVPTTPEECAAMGAAAERDECYLVVAPLVFKTDAAAGIALVEEGITDPLTRDIAWYNVTKQVDPHSNKYCDRMSDPTLQKRCRDVVSRPHLHRELTGKENGPGSPPPGGSPPGGSPPGGSPPGGSPPGGSPPPAAP
jgi:hypothetical protein